MDKIAESLGIEPLTNVLTPLFPTQTTAPAVIPPETTKSVITDQESARENLRRVAKKAEDILDEVATFAQSSQTAKGYEALSRILEQTISANRALAEAAARTQEVSRVEDNRQVHNNTTQNVFVGSTAEFLSMIRKELKES